MGTIDNQFLATKLALSYERAHATHPKYALQQFVRDQWADMARMARIGPGKHAALIGLELACAEVGLNYAQTHSQLGPIWKLPDAFTEMAIESLPEHPLIDLTFLAQLVKNSPAAPLSALQALHLLSQSDGLEMRWNKVPRVGHAGPSQAGNARIAVCLHLFYPSLWPTIKQALNAIPKSWDLYISVPIFSCTPALARIAEEHPNCRFLPCVNRGRDVLPLIRWLETGVFDSYDVVCKLHSKRSPHMKHGRSWFDRILNSLLPGTEAVAGVIENFSSDARLGLIGPQSELVAPGNRQHSGTNHAGLRAFITQARLPEAAKDAPFFSGTMFWFRPAALTALRDMKLQTQHFPLEMGQTDGTTAHVIERLLGPLVEKAGFTVDKM